MITVAPSRDVIDYFIWSKENVLKINRFLDSSPLFQPALPVIAHLSTQPIHAAMCVEHGPAFAASGEPPLDAVIATFLLCTTFSIHLVDTRALWSEYITAKVLAAAASPEGLPTSVCRMLLWSKDDDRVPRMQRLSPWHVLLGALTVLMRGNDSDEDAPMLEVAKQVILQVGWVLLTEPVNNHRVNEAAKDAFAKLPLDTLVTILSDDMLGVVDTELNVVGLCHLWWSRQSDDVVKSAPVTGEALSSCVRLPALGCILAEAVLARIPWASRADVPKFLALCKEYPSTEMWSIDLDGRTDVPAAWRRSDVLAAWRRLGDRFIHCEWYTVDTVHVGTDDVKTTDFMSCLRYGLVWELREDTEMHVRWPAWADFLPPMDLKVLVRLEYTRPEDDVHEHEYELTTVPGHVQIKCVADSDGNNGDDRGREHVRIKTMCILE